MAINGATNRTEQYILDNKTLVRTMVIKSSVSADAINNWLITQDGGDAVDLYDPTTWKYYLNLSGEYHSTDTVMEVISLDTLEPMVFSKANLATNPETASQYMYGTVYYYKLLAQYPTQEQIIIGMVYPVDINIAIGATDGTILSYPDYLVESQELTLVYDLQTYIQNWIVRWTITGYGFTDNLFYTAQHAILYLSILPKLLNLRLLRCKTYEAHTYHIKEYLSSHGSLDVYIPYMTLEQILYFYRNIAYIERNSGIDKQFYTLVTEVLTKRFIPLSQFTIRQQNSVDSENYTNILVNETPINPEISTPEVPYFDLNTLFTKETTTTYGNKAYLLAEQTKMTNTLKNLTATTLQTKDLQSAMLDYSNDIPDTLDSVMMAHWVYMASVGLYTTNVDFKDPDTGNTITLPCKEAFVYMYYITLKAMGIDPPTIPDYWVNKRSTNPSPTLAQLMSVANNTPDLTAIASKLIANHTHLTQCNTPTQFYSLTSSIFNELLYNYYLTSSEQDYVTRAMVANMVLKFYVDGNIIFYPTPVATTDWLKANNLPAAYTYSLASAKTLIANIFNAGSGYTPDPTKSLVNIQKAMVGIMTELGSYSLQYMTEINLSNILPLSITSVRLGNLKYNLTEDIEADIGIGVFDTQYLLSSDMVVDFSSEPQGKPDAINLSASVNLLNDGVYETVINTEVIMAVPLNGLSLGFTYTGFDPTVSSTTDFIGWETYLALTTTQKKQIKYVN